MYVVGDVCSTTVSWAIRHCADVGSLADTYTLKAIGQDDFSDVPIPDAPAQQGSAPHASGNVRSAGSANDVREMA